MTFTYRRTFGTHQFSILEDGATMAEMVSEKDAVRIIEALNYFEGK